MIGPDPVEIFDALGIGWGVYELYPNPVEQQAFLSAAKRLEALGEGSITYEIGAGTVVCDGEELNLERGGTSRLSLRLFVHEVEWLELVGVPTPPDLSQLFTLLAADENDTRAAGGIASALQLANVSSISVIQRGLLTEVLEKPWEERAAEGSPVAAEDEGEGVERVARLATMVAVGASAEEVADALQAGVDDDPARMADAFCNAYRLVYPGDDPGADDESEPDLLAAYRHVPVSKPPIDTFAAAFFLLPLDAQVQILSDFLTSRADGFHSLLLDQFAGVELAELAPHLDETSYNELVNYARDVVDTDTGSADELLPMVSGAKDVKSARMSAADRIREMIDGIGGFGGATGGLAGQLRDETGRAEELGLYVLRVLFEVEDRPDRFDRLVDTWSRGISEEVEAGNMERALAALSVGVDKVELSPAKQGAVEDGLVELLRSDYTVFSQAAADPQSREEVAELLQKFGEPAATHLLERLSDEEDPATRRILIGLLVVVGARFPGPILRFFKDPRWFVVRNAVTIAGKIGGEQWVPHLRQLLDHADHRVVVEAMRALAPIAPDEAVPGLVRGLAHPHERVRETALVLLQASASRVRQEELAKAFTDPAMAGARTHVASLLFDIGTPRALGVLQQLAKKQFVVSPVRREARRAAREVLGRAA
ncbi:MAG: HEAT repeat domain-containing protein [Acidimicrobiia bacterium]